MYCKGRIYGFLHLLQRTLATACRQSLKLVLNWSLIWMFSWVTPSLPYLSCHCNKCSPVGHKVLFFSIVSLPCCRCSPVTHGLHKTEFWTSALVIGVLKCVHWLRGAHILSHCYIRKEKYLHNW